MLFDSIYSFLFQDALEYTMRYGLWGHAMVLASKMDKKVQNEVTNRYDYSSDKPKELKKLKNKPRQI